MLELLSLIECYNTYDQEDIYFDVARSMLENYNQIKTSTIQEFAENLHISVSTANRFLRQMYYDNFSAFRMYHSRAEENYQYDGKYYPAVKDETVAPQTYGHILAEKIEEVTSTIDMEQIQSLVSLIEVCDEVIFAGIPVHSEVWRLQVELVLMGKKTSAFIDPNYQLKAVQQADEKAVIISLIYMRQHTNHIDQLLLEAKKRGAKTVFISHSKKQTIQDDVDLSFVYEGTNTQLDSLIMQIYLNYIGIFLRNKIRS